MSVETRDFSTFELGDNVYELADGIIPEIAERLEVPITSSPSSDDLQAIMQRVGPNKVLRSNVEITAIERDEMAALIDRSGIQERLRRSLWGPKVGLSGFQQLQGRIAMGGVANWQDRGAAKLEHEHTRVPIYLPAGNRVMDTATEATNLNVADIKALYGRYPTEAEYAASVILPRLTRWGRSVLTTSYETGDGGEILQRFFEQNPQLTEGNISVVRVANAGVLFALQARKAARTVNPEFDSDPNSPQLYIETDTFPIARTDEQDRSPAQFQKAATAMRQLVLTAKKLHEAA